MKTKTNVKAGANGKGTKTTAQQSTTRAPLL